MEDIVAIRAQAEHRRIHFLLTWGRTFDRHDPAKLLSAIAPHLEKFGISPKMISLCDTLQEASKSSYFYESFFSMTQEKIPFGPGYKKWARSKCKLILKGKEIYYTGLTKRKA